MAEQKAALQELSRSDVRGEADRASAILLTLQAWTSPQVAQAFGVSPDAVRHRRGWFSERGVDALRSTLAPGPSPEKGQRALEVASLLLSQRVEERATWVLPRLLVEIERQTGAAISTSRLSVLLKRGSFRWCRPRHTLSGRQDRTAVERKGLCLRQAQAETGDITLLHADESEALTRPYLAYIWVEQGVDLRVWASGRLRKMATMEALDAVTRELLVHASPTKTSADFRDLLELLDWRSSPKSCHCRPMVLVLDNGVVHTSKASTTARLRITIERLPSYTPGLNDIERTWRDLECHHLAHKTFKIPGDLECATYTAVKTLIQERQMTHPCDGLKKAA